MSKILLFIKRKFTTRNLRFDILSSFFFLQIVTAFSIVFYMYTNNAETLVGFSDKMMEELSDSKIDKITNRFQDVQVSVRLGSFLIRDFESVDIRNKNLLDYIIQTVQQYPFLESMFIGLESGRFFQVKRVTDGSSYRSSPGKLLPKNAQYAVRVLDRLEKAQEVWYYLDREARVLETEILPEFQITFDHKTREWYTKALQTRSQIWTDIYIFSTTKLPGVATGHPLQNAQGQYIGVIGADIPLESISDILKENALKGLSVVLNRKGEIVAHPTERNTAKVINGTEAQLITVDDLPDKLSSVAYRQYIQSQNSRFIFENDKQSYIANYKNFDSSLFKSWFFCIIIPMDVFVGEVKETQKKTLLICFTILSLSIFLIAYVARRIATPINQLADQANRITHFDLTEMDEIQSGIGEIQRLQNSITKMRRSLISFSKFVPKTLVQKLLDKKIDPKIGGKVKRLTIFFSDIAGFTNISETFPADRLMHHLSEYFDEMTRIVLDGHGTIDKYIGDAIMAFWGAPQNDKDHALHACKTALLCQKRLQDLNKKWIFEKKPPLFTRIGIHSGDVIVGNLGSTERMNYTVLGDSVNLAARLEGTNKIYDTCILISHDVLGHLGDTAVVRPLDIVAVKGKNEGVRIYELVALKKSDPLLVPTKMQSELCHDFAKGFQLYLEQRWDEALDVFQAILKNFSHDHTTKMYIERCETFKLSPPGEGWDGVYHLKTK